MWLETFRVPIATSTDVPLFHCCCLLTCKCQLRIVLCPCSAGVGRTGTFIVIDAMIDMMQAEQKVDVFGFVSKIREQRSQLIQTDVSRRRDKFPLV